MWWNALGCSLKPALGGLRTLLGCLLLLACAVTSVSAQLNPQSGMLEQSGWKALAAGDARAAADAFERALAIDPKNARLHLGAGAAAYRERRDADGSSTPRNASRSWQVTTDRRAGSPWTRWA